MPLDVNRMGVDLLSISAHKIYGPKGAGALYVRTGTPLEPQFHGGHHERDRRPGTENVPGIVGLGRAAELAREKLSEDSARVSRLRDKFEQGVIAAVSGAKVNGADAARVPNTRASRSEFEARRLAPCRPVEAHSPTAHSPSSEDRPRSSLAMPPMW